MISKRGISQIVTTILIILLALAAIVIVWQAVRGTVEDTTDVLKSKSSCLDVELKIVEGTETCLKPGPQFPSIVNAKISRGTDNGGAIEMIIVADNTAQAAQVAPTALGTIDMAPVTVGPVPETEVVLKVAPKIGDQPCDPTDEVVITCTTS